MSIISILDDLSTDTNDTMGTVTSEHIRGKGVPFDRIRRITGYLVGSMESWNNAKRAEEKDRVKHI